MYREARTVGEFFDLHPGNEAHARADFTDDLKKQLCSTPGLGPRDFKKAELDHAVGRARAVLAATARGQAPGALAAAVGAVTAAPTRQTPTESELLSSFAAHEELEEEPVQK